MRLKAHSIRKRSGDGWESIGDINGVSPSATQTTEYAHTESQTIPRSWSNTPTQSSSGFDWVKTTFHRQHAPDFSVVIPTVGSEPPVVNYIKSINGVHEDENKNIDQPVNLAMEFHTKQVSVNENTFKQWFRVATIGPGHGIVFVTVWSYYQDTDLKITETYESESMVYSEYSHDKEAPVGTLSVVVDTNDASFRSLAIDANINHTPPPPEFADIETTIFVTIYSQKEITEL